MGKHCSEENWDSAANSAQQFEEEDNEEEEALSLSDLPLIQNSNKEKDKYVDDDNGIQKDFDFCLLTKDQSDSDMCAADEVFFQGQIMPLRHSISSEKGLLWHQNGISRSASMDCCSSTGLVSSRSSSIGSSHQSSSSSSGGGNSAVSIIPPPKQRIRKKPPQNHFHSHPSPSPKLNFNRKSVGIVSNNRNVNTKKTSAVWNIFRLGLVTTPPEIAFQDYRARCPNNSLNTNNSFGSRNSTSSNGSCSGKKRNPMALLGGCNCTIDAVDTVRLKAVDIKNSSGGACGDSESTVALRVEEEDEEPKAEKNHHQVSKKQFLHNRTFEWIKQLSIQSSAEEA